LFLFRLTVLLGSILLGVSTVSADPRIKIGFLVKMPEENWFQKEWQFADRAGKDLGFDVIKIGATDGLKVLSAIDSLGAQGAKGFVICAPDVKLGPAIVARAQKYHMKVLAVDDQLLGADGLPMKSVPYVGISAREIGARVGLVCWNEMRHRGWRFEETGVIAISFKELETARERVEGASTFLLTEGMPPQSLIEVSQKTTDVEGGFNAVSVAITKNPSIRHWLVFAINDESVIGGVQALEGRGFRADDVIGVGINGMALAVSELRKASTGFFGSILLDPRRHGYDTAAMLYHWVVHNRVPPLDTRTTGTLITRQNFVEVLRAHNLGDLVR